MLNQDFAGDIRQALIAESTGPHSAPLIEEAVEKRLQDCLEAKRAKARFYLGDRWVFSPNYSTQIYAHHHPSHKTSSVLAPVVSKASREGRI